MTRRRDFSTSVNPEAALNYGFAPRPPAGSAPANPHEWHPRPLTDAERAQAQVGRKSTYQLACECCFKSGRHAGVSFAKLARFEKGRSYLKFLHDKMVADNSDTYTARMLQVFFAQSGIKEVLK